MGTKRLALATVVASIALLGLTTGSASARTDGTCNGLGTLKATNGKPANWTLSASGSCVSSPVGRQVTLSGTGTSDSLGLCTPGSLLVTNLRLNVDITFTNEPTGDVEHETQTWHSPVSLFPILTPYLVQRSTHSGFPARLAGVALHHLTLKCNNFGQAPAASFTWISA